MNIMILRNNKIKMNDALWNGFLPEIELVFERNKN